MQNLKLATNTALSGRYKIQVVDAKSGKVVEDRPFAPNLILNTGLNGLCTSGYPSLTYGWSRCRVGTGTTPVMRQTDPITVTCSGNTATASAPFFEAGDANRLLKMGVGSAGEERTITTFTSTTEVTFGGATLADGPSVATVWYVNQTGLTTLVKTTNTYFTDGGACGTVEVGGGVWTGWRTYDFTIEVSPQNYTELAIGNFQGGGQDYCLARMLIAGGTVTVLAGQLLRVRYELTYGWSPTTPVGMDWNVTGWTAPEGDWVFWATEYPYITNSTGGLVNPYPRIAPSQGIGDNVRLFIPSSWPTVEYKGFLSVTAQGLAALAGYSDKTPVAAAYTPGNFYVDWTASWAVSEGNNAAWEGVNIGVPVNAWTGNGWVWKWDTPKEKLNTHTLTLTYRRSISRVITNP